MLEESVYKSVKVVLQIIAYIILGFTLILTISVVGEVLVYNFQERLTQEFMYQELTPLLIFIPFSIVLAFLFLLPVKLFDKHFKQKEENRTLSNKVLSIITSTDKISFEKLEQLTKTPIHELTKIIVVLVQEQKYKGYINWDKRYFATGTFYHMEMVCGICGSGFNKKDKICSYCGAPKSKAYKI